MKKLISSILLISIGAACFAQIPELAPLKAKKVEQASAGLIPFEKKGLWGYTDIKGKVLVKPVFDSIEPHDSYGLSRVSSCGKVGLVGKYCTYILEPCWDSIGEFDSHRLARFTSGGKVGLLTINGQTVLPAEYDSISEYYDGYAIVSKGGRLGTVNYKGEILLQPVYESIDPVGDTMFQVVRDGKTGLVDRKGLDVLPVKYDTFEVGASGKFYIVSDNGKWGTVDLNGGEIEALRFDSIKLHKSGGFYVIALNGQFGVMTTFGSVYREPDYDEIDPEVNNDIVFIRQNGRAGAITSEGKFKIVAFFDELLWPEGTSDYILVRSSETGKYGAIDLTGKKILDTDFDQAPVLTDSRRLFFGAGRYVFADKKGSITLKALDEELSATMGLDYGSTDLIPQAAKAFYNRKAESDKKDKIVFKTEWCTFQGMKIGGCGLWNETQGLWKLRPVYECPDDNYIKCGDWSIGVFKDGRASVGYAGKYGVIDEDGNFIVKLK